MKFTVSGVLLDACVLGALSASPTYGYDLTQKAQSLLDVSESTLYPVLRRLLKDGMLETYDEPYDGRNRRYYKLTDKGLRALGDYTGEWHRYRKNIENLLVRGGRNSEQS